MKKFMVKVLIAKYEMVEVEADTEELAMEQAEMAVSDPYEDDDFIVEAQEATKL